MTDFSRAVLAILVIAAGIYDFRFRRIPNWLNMSGLAFGFGLNVYLGGLGGLRAATLGMVLAVAVYLPLYLVRGMGAGDVKLMAAVGAIAGPQHWFVIFVATALSGGLIGLSVVVLKRRLGETVLNLGALIGELAHFRSPAATETKLDVRSNHGLRLPHGVAIAAGSLVFVLWG